MNNLNVKDAIAKAKELRPSEVTDDTMLRWLQALDGQIWTEIISQYKDPYPPEIPTYDASDLGPDVDHELLASSPYDLMYIDYLVMRIDLENADYERYNNGAQRFREEWQAYVDWYNRNHEKVAGKLESGVYYNWAISF